MTGERLAKAERSIAAVLPGFAVDRELDRLLDAPSTNVFILKLTYWLGQ